MANSSPNKSISWQHGGVASLVATLFIGIIWLFKGPTDQELMANAAKALDFHPWSGWWSDSFLGGASQAPGLTTLLSYLVLKIFMLPFGVMLGSKVACLLAVFLGGLGVATFVQRWTGDLTAAWVAAAAYIIGPQMALRLAGNEHLPVVLSMVFAPWILWSLLELADSPNWRNAMITALLGSGMTLAFTKLAVVFFPVVLVFSVSIAVGGQGAVKSFVTGLLRALVFYIPLAVIPLLPTLREVQWLAMFQFDPFAAWQQNFSLKTVLSWGDRGNVLQAGMPPGFTADLGGFYVGVLALGTGLIAWWISLNKTEECDAPLVGALKTAFGMLLFLSWLSAGPRSIAQGLMEFLKSSAGASDVVIPLFWVFAAGQCVLLWVLWPDHPRRDAVRIVVLAAYLFVPGFRLLELLPVAHDIRAPWSVWQAGGSLFTAVLFGLGVSLLLKKIGGGGWTGGVPALLFLVLLAGDYSVYLLRYGIGGLAQGTYPAFEQICSRLKQMPANGSVYPLSGRYFYLGIPALTGKPIEQEAFNSYFGLTWRRALQNASMTSPEAIRTGLSLMGCSYVFIDKQDPNTPQELQRTFLSIFPVVAENEWFVILGNPASLAPAFLARDFVALPRGSFAMAPAAIQLFPQNIVTVEMSGVDQSMSGYAGTAKGTNQIELLQKYQGKAGAPFQVVACVNKSTEIGRLSLEVPPGSSGWLITTKAYHPDWTAIIDGRPAEVHRAEAALLSAYVPAGARTVTFEFNSPLWYPVAFWIGVLAWITSLGLLVLLANSGCPAAMRKWSMN